MIAYIFATLIGLSLGLLGGGGSILTVPVLVYAMGFEAKLAIALSLAIVGITSIFGVLGHHKNKNIDYKIAMIFGPIAMLGTYIGARLSQFLSSQTQLILFGIIMILAAGFLLKEKKGNDREKVKQLNYLLIAIEGIVVGIVTGLVGVGGGFLIVPALVLLTGLEMKKAVGTSLLIISLKSFSGFIGYVGLVDVPWIFLAYFSSFSVLGIFIGIKISKYTSQEQLKKLFAIFLIGMGAFVLYRQ